MKADSTTHLPSVRPEVSRAWLHIRLQLMLAKLDFKLNQDPNDESRGSMSGYFLAAICEMAILAAEGGLNGFASICLRMAERIEPYRRHKALPDPALRALGAWMLHADRYLRRPSSRVRSSSLVRRLDDDAWGLPLEREEWAHLLDEFAGDMEAATHAQPLVSTPH